MLLMFWNIVLKTIRKNTTRICDMNGSMAVGHTNNLYLHVDLHKLNDKICPEISEVQLARRFREVLPNVCSEKWTWFFGCRYCRFR